MGTFHHGKHELHGITVAVDTDGPELYVGRCHDLDAERVILLDVDVHCEGEGGRSKDEYLRRAAVYGVFKKHDSVVLDRRRVTSVRRLADVA